MHLGGNRHWVPLLSLQIYYLNNEIGFFLASVPKSPYFINHNFHLLTNNKQICEWTCHNCDKTPVRSKVTRPLGRKVSMRCNPTCARSKHPVGGVVSFHLLVSELFKHSFKYIYIKFYEFQNMTQIVKNSGIESTGSDCVKLRNCLAGYFSGTTVFLTVSLTSLLVKACFLQKSRKRFLIFSKKHENFGPEKERQWKTLKVSHRWPKLEIWASASIGIVA